MFVTVITCAPPVGFTNAYIIDEQGIYMYQEEVLYACNTGYEMTGGDSASSCLPTGTWNNSGPTCTRELNNKHSITLVKVLTFLVPS